jgi:transcriptional regulator with XRE-family HTH domain
MPRALRINRDAARFGAILKQLREQRGWTRQKLAQRSGVTPTYIGILEYGGNIPSLPMVLELLGADIGEVMRRLAAARRRSCVGEPKQRRTVERSKAPLVAGLVRTHPRPFRDNKSGVLRPSSATTASPLSLRRLRMTALHVQPHHSRVEWVLR